MTSEPTQGVTNTPLLSAICPSKSKQLRDSLTSHHIQTETPTRWLNLVVSSPQAINFSPKIALFSSSLKKACSFSTTVDSYRGNKVVHFTKMVFFKTKTKNWCEDERPMRNGGGPAWRVLWFSSKTCDLYHRFPSSNLKCIGSRFYDRGS